MKKAMMISYLILFFFILATCARKVESEIQVNPASEIQEIELVKAKQLVETTCISCHSATAPENSRMAPPLEAVKRRYLIRYPNIEDFSTAIASFVAHPTEESALMYGAIERFNLMPAVPLSEDDLKAIGTYMYQYELERPAWFEEHYQEMHGNRGKGRGMRRGVGGG